MSRKDLDGFEHHTLWENVQGISTGVFMTALGLVMLTSAGLFIGQAAGLALIISKLTETPFGIWFFVVNTPFFLFGVRRLGWDFALRSILAIAGISILATIIPQYMIFESLHPLLGAVANGTLAGIGILAALRHGAGLGGVSVAAAAVQEWTGFRAGYFLYATDAIIFGIAAFLYDLDILLYSLLGAAILNGLIAVNHRSDWYAVKFR